MRRASPRRFGAAPVGRIGLHLAIGLPKLHGAAVAVRLDPADRLRVILAVQLDRLADVPRRIEEIEPVVRHQRALPFA